MKLNVSLPCLWSFWLVAFHWNISFAKGLLLGFSENFILFWTLNNKRGFYIFASNSLLFSHYSNFVILTVLDNLLSGWNHLIISSRSLYLIKNEEFPVQILRKVSWFETFPLTLKLHKFLDLFVSIFLSLSLFLSPSLSLSLFLEFYLSFSVSFSLSVPL